MSWPKPSWILLAEDAAPKKPEEKVALPGVIELVTAEQLQQCATSMSDQRATIMAALINKLFPKYGVTTKNALHELLANLLQESLEFQHRVENMYYRAQTLANTWPSTFSATKNKPYTPNDLARRYERQPKALANFIYGTRMGNRPGTDDGWNLRGSGFTGLTGRWVLQAFAKFKGFATAEEAASYARDSDYGGLESSLWFFTVLKNLIPKAEADDMIGIVKEINGGTIGLKDRLYYYGLCKENII